MICKTNAHPADNFCCFVIVSSRMMGTMAAFSLGSFRRAALVDRA